MNSTFPEHVRNQHGVPSENKGLLVLFKLAMFEV